jgi:hemerythrin-like domain-containing protein
MPLGAASADACVALAHSLAELGLPPVEARIGGRRVRLGSEAFCQELCGFPPGGPAHPNFDPSFVFLAEEHAWLAAFERERFDPKGVPMKAISILKSEHRSISAVLHALKELARMAQDATVRPRFQVLRSILRYIDEYPEKLHHPKEDEYLFARLVARAPETGLLVEELQAEHDEGARLVRELERALLFFEEGWPAGAPEFQQAVQRYAEFHWKHMRKEEQELLPLAERHLTAADWDAIDAAFAANQDPVAGTQERDFAKLFTRIVNLAPEPVGLGARWKSA